MFKNTELGAVGIDTLAVVLDMERETLAEDVSVSEDGHGGMVMQWNTYAWHGFDFRSDGGLRERVIPVIDDPSAFNQANRNGPIVKRGIYFSPESNKIDIGWYLTRQADQAR